MAVFFIVILIIAELIVRLLVHQGILTHYQYGVVEKPTFIDDINRDFGVWHYPEKEAHMAKECFDVVIKSNSYGAVDREREKTSDERRVVVLGDSFVEGFGVASENRFTERLEAKTGIEHLNFGTSGNFGSIQEMVQYKTMASKFSHSAVYVFTLPDNDFKDNDRSKFGDKYRYRPYYDKDFNIVYPVEFEDRNKQRLTKKGVIKNKIANNVYIYNVLRQVVAGLKEKKTAFLFVKPAYADENVSGNKNMDKIGREARYYEFSEEDIKTLLHSYEDMLKAAGDKPLVIFTIPRYQDIHRYMETKEEPPIAKKIAAFAAEHKNVYYYDLMQGIADYDFKGRKTVDMFHSCDGHWSPYGHEVIADIVEKYMDSVSDIYTAKDKKAPAVFK
jgi:lysophospholipase L1-like esterase